MPSLEDIDEDDDYVPSSSAAVPPPSSNGSGHSNAAFDPFGDHQNNGSTAPPVVPQKITYSAPPPQKKSTSKNDLDDFFSSPSSSQQQSTQQWGGKNNNSVASPTGNNNNRGISSSKSNGSDNNSNDFMDFTAGSKTAVQSHHGHGGSVGARDLVDKLNMAAKGIHVRAQPTLSEMGTTCSSNTDILANPTLLKRMSHYEVLGIVNPTYADEEDISRQYKKKALALHPDKFKMRQGRDPTEHEEALFKAIVRAHEVLMDAPRRKQYDLDLAHARRFGIPIEDINSETMMGGGGPPPPQANDDYQPQQPVYSAPAAQQQQQQRPPPVPTNDNLWDSKKPSAAKVSDLDDLFAPAPSKSRPAATHNQQQASSSTSTWGGKATTSAPTKATTSSGYGGKQSTDIDDLFS